MPSKFLIADSFVLYKQRPARIVEPGEKKITIQTEGGERLSVRPKDVQLLHRGPLRSLGELNRADTGDIMAAWELLAGETTTLQELSELAFEEFTPASAWAIWQLVEDGLYFRADEPDAIDVQSAAEVAAVEAERAAKAAEEAAWIAFAARINRNSYLPEDEARLADVVIITNDNPRGEAPKAIVSDILEGITRRDSLFVELDRSAAIREAAAMVTPGDVILLAGKGHETVQLIGTERLPFNDVEELRQIRPFGS